MKILFVCHGNICRSPMAEFVMKDLVKKAGREAEFYIESAATSTEEIGNDVYPATRRKLAEHGIACNGKRARQMTRNDYDRFDLLVGMDSWNIRNMKAICVDDTDGKIVRLLDLTDRPGDVADPWYTGDFNTTYNGYKSNKDSIIDHIYCSKGVKVVEYHTIKERYNGIKYVSDHYPIYAIVKLK